MFAGNYAVDKFVLSQALPNFYTGDTMRNILNFGNFLPVDNEVVAVIGTAVLPADVAITQSSPQILGPEDIMFLQNQYEHSHAGGAGVQTGLQVYTAADLDALRDFTRLRNTFYTVAPRTNMPPELFNIDQFMQEDLTITLQGDLPKVLIFHTHTTELFSDSRDISEGIVAVGAYMKQVLESRHGIPALHITESFDIVDGRPSIAGSYERMEPRIRQILDENPSIQVVLDLHRDGVPEHLHLITEVNGLPTAQIMFFNGLSMLYQDGVLSDILSLPNPYLPTNLALSFRMQLAANEMFPGFARRIFLNAFRYSLHMRPKSMLLEIGAQTNTLQEALNAVEPTTDILARVILRGG